MKLQVSGLNTEWRLAMQVSDFIGRKVVIHLPDIPELNWYSLTPTGKYKPQNSPYNNKIGTVTAQYTDEKMTEGDQVVVVQLKTAHILPNGNKVSWLPLSICDIEIVD